MKAGHLGALALVLVACGGGSGLVDMPGDDAGADVHQVLDAGEGEAQGDELDAGGPILVDCLDFLCPRPGGPDITFQVNAAGPSFSCSPLAPAPRPCPSGAACQLWQDGAIIARGVLQVTDGAVLVVIGPYARVQLDAGGTRWARVRPGSTAHPGQRVRLSHEPGAAWPTAIPSRDVSAPCP